MISGTWAGFLTPDHDSACLILRGILSRFACPPCPDLRSSIPKPVSFCVSPGGGSAAWKGCLILRVTPSPSLSRNPVSSCVSPLPLPAGRNPASFCVSRRGPHAVGGENTRRPAASLAKSCLIWRIPEARAFSQMKCRHRRPRGTRGARLICGRPSGRAAGMLASKPASMLATREASRQVSRLVGAPVTRPARLPSRRLAG